MSYYYEQTPWGVVITPTVYFDVDLYHEVEGLLGALGRTQLLRTGPDAPPLYAVPCIHGVTVTVTLRGESPWETLHLSVSTGSYLESVGTILEKLEFLTVEQQLCGGARSRVFPRQTRLETISRHIATLDVPQHPDEVFTGVTSGRFIDYRSWFKTQEPSYYGCILGDWAIRPVYHYSDPVLELWRCGAGRPQMLLGVESHTPAASLTALARRFGRGSVPPQAPDGAAGHEAFSLVPRRTLGGVTVYERRLLGYPFDWVAVGEDGAFARGVTARAAICALRGA